MPRTGCRSGGVRPRLGHAAFVRRGGHPLIITFGFIAHALSDWTGGDMTKSLSIIVWIPVVLIITGAVLGRDNLHAAAGAGGPCCRSPPRFGIVGITVVFAFAGANALAATGLPSK